MKVLLLGATGLAGQAFSRALNIRNINYVSAARKNAQLQVDIADMDALHNSLYDQDPDIVINAAAIVDIDACSHDPDRCWRVNTQPLAILAEWARSTNRPVIQISTDHYYTHDGNYSHTENDPICFVNDYAASKFAAESLILTAPRALVLRTSILGLRGWRTQTFAEWAISSVEKDAAITLFDDAWTSSIDTDSFAAASLDLLLDHGICGLLNVGSREVYSKGCLIREISRQMGMPLSRATSGSVHVNRVQRATSLGLDISRSTAILGRPFPCLEEVVASILGQKKDKTNELCK